MRGRRGNRQSASDASQVGLAAGTVESRPAGLVERSLVVEVLKARGDRGTASTAERSLPDRIYPGRDKDMLDRFGVSLDDRFPGEESA